MEYFLNIRRQFWKINPAWDHPPEAGNGTGGDLGGRLGVVVARNAALPNNAFRPRSRGAHIDIYAGILCAQAPEKLLLLHGFQDNRINCIYLWPHSDVRHMGSCVRIYPYIGCIWGRTNARLEEAYS